MDAHIYSNVRTAVFFTRVRFIMYCMVVIVLHGYYTYALNTRKIPDKHFTIIVPSYNNKDYYQGNLDSIFAQKYAKFHVVYIDDCSQDGTADLVQAYIDTHKVQSKITLIRNSERHLKLYNMYHHIHTFNDQSIVVEVDGDDKLAHSQVLQKLNEIYHDPRVWMTYGQYVKFPSHTLGICRTIPDAIMLSKNYRKYPWITSHLKTYYTWLFKRIQKEDLMYEGEFYRSTADQAYMFPMLEMAGFHARFIKDVLYVYNVATPLNDDKVNRELQLLCESHIRQGRIYDRLNQHGA